MDREVCSCQEHPQFDSPDRDALSSLVSDYCSDHRKQSGRDSTVPVELLIVNVFSLWKYQWGELVPFFLAVLCFSATAPLIHTWELPGFLLLATETLHCWFSATLLLASSRCNSNFWSPASFRSPTDLQHVCYVLSLFLFIFCPTTNHTEESAHLLTNFNYGPLSPIKVCVYATDRFRLL